MPKVNLPVRVEPGLYDLLKRQAGEKSLSAHVEGLLETMLASQAGADLNAEECAAALEEMDAALAAAEQQISQISSERDNLRAALGRAQQQVTLLDGERNRLTSYLENARSTPTITYRQPSPTAQQLAEERRSHLDQLVKARQKFLGIGIVLTLPLCFLTLLLTPHDTLLAQGIARAAMAPFADAQTAGRRLMGEDAAFAWLLRECPLAKNAILIAEARRAEEARKAEAHCAVQAKEAGPAGRTGTSNKKAGQRSAALPGPGGR